MTRAADEIEDDADRDDAEPGNARQDDPTDDLTDDLDQDADSDGGAGRSAAGDVSGGRSRSSRAVRLVRIAIGAIVILVVAAVAAFLLHGPGTPGDDSVAAGLARDMIDHHAQAVDMATIVQARTKDDAIRFLATDIALTQTSQMGQMQGWLNVWGLSIGRTGPAMAWMTANDQGMQMGSAGTMDPSLMRLQANGLMPGMATQQQVNQLRTLVPAKADVLFLQLMINHHRGGVAMAQTAIDETKEPVVVALCQTIVKSQQQEIVQMTALLEQRGAVPAA